MEASWWRHGGVMVASWWRCSGVGVLMYALIISLFLFSLAGS